MPKRPMTFRCMLCNRPQYGSGYARTFSIYKQPKCECMVCKACAEILDKLYPAQVEARARRRERKRRQLAALVDDIQREMLGAEADVLDDDVGAK